MVLLPARALLPNQLLTDFDQYSFSSYSNNLKVERMEPAEIKSRILLKIQGKLYNVKRVEKGKKEYLLEVADIETEEKRTFIIKSIHLLKAMENLPQKVKEKKTKKFLLLDADEGTWQICGSNKLKNLKHTDPPEAQPRSKRS